jgi:hypothetical protein
MNYMTVTMGVLFLFFPLFSENPSQKGIRDDTPFIQFCAGIELLDHSKNLSENRRAEKYRELCLMTGLNAVSAAEYIKRFNNTPEHWQAVQAKVLETLQTLR